MTRLICIETCEQCPWPSGSRGCRHPNALWDDEGIVRIKVFTDFPLIPDWCPLEQVAPDWRPPATIDLYGPPRYSRGTTDGTSASNLDGRRSP